MTFLSSMIEFENKIIEREHFNRIKVISRIKDDKVLREKLIEFLTMVKPRSQRSGQQRKSIEVFCGLLAEELNTKGKDMKQVIKWDIWWTQESVKKHIFKPVMKAMTNKESTTQLEKGNGEIDKIHEMIMKELGEKHGIEYIEFPHYKVGSTRDGKIKLPE